MSKENATSYNGDSQGLQEVTNGGAGGDWGSDLVACRTVQSGNRTLETVTVS